MHGERLLVVPMGGGDAARLGEGEASQRHGAFSPDGRWLAYEEIGSDGQPDGYIRAVDARGGSLKR